MWIRALRAPGYSQFGYGEGMNEAAAIAEIIESLFTLAVEPDIRSDGGLGGPRLLLLARWIVQ